MSGMVITNSSPEKPVAKMKPSEFNARKARRKASKRYGKIVKNIACPKCREKGGDSTGNHLMIFEDGGGYCSRCPKKYSSEQVEDVKNGTVFKQNSVSSPSNGTYAFNRPQYQNSRFKPDFTLEDILQFGHLGDDKRGISEHTDAHFGIRTEIDTKNRRPVSRYYPMHNEGDLIGYKNRILPKDWGKAVGTIKGCDLFGWHLCTGTRRTLLITEGEEDCAAAWQLNRRLNLNSSRSTIKRQNPHVVSLPDGAKGVLKILMHHFEEIIKYDKIIWLGDNPKLDEEGALSLEIAVQVLGVDKFYVPEYPEHKKDMCDVLKMGYEQSLDVFSDMFFNCEKYRPADVKKGEDYTWDEVFKEPVIGLDLPFESLSKVLGGLRLREHTVLMAAPGIGKSTICRKIGHYMGQAHKWVTGSVYLEEQDTKTVQGYISCHLKIALNVLRADPDMVPEEDRKAAMDMIAAEHMLLTHTGSIDPEVLMNKVRYMYNSGCKLIIFDHLTMAVNGEADQRIALDTLLEHLYTFCENHDVHILSVIHLNRDSKQLFSRGAEITENNLRGSAGVLQQVWNAIAIEGDIQHEKYKLSRWFRVLKCREIGNVGLVPGGYTYDVTTGEYIYDEDLDKSVLFEDAFDQQKSKPTMGGSQSGKYDNKAS